MRETWNVISDCDNIQIAALQLNISNQNSGFIIQESSMDTDEKFMGYQIVKNGSFNITFISDEHDISGGDLELRWKCIQPGRIVSTTPKNIFRSR